MTLYKKMSPSLPFFLYHESDINSFAWPKSEGERTQHVYTNIKIHSIQKTLNIIVDIKPKVRIDIWCTHSTIHTVYSIFIFCPPFLTSFLPNNVYTMHNVTPSIKVNLNIRYQLYLTSSSSLSISLYHLTKY